MRCSSLIGGRGSYALTPTGRYVWGGHYEDGGLIWRSRWVTESGTVECREALAFPGDPRRVVLLRRVVAVRGDAEVQVVLDPAAGFGRDGMKERRRDQDGCWHARCGPLWLRWSGAAHAHTAGPEGNGALRDTLRVPEGAHHDLVLELSTSQPDDPAPQPDRLWEATETAWSEATPALADSVAPRDARHSYAVLRGLTSSGGGMVAAATMSLPERAAQGRTTTTATSGSATSATPGKPSPPLGRTRCWMTRSGSSPNVC
ncbi:MAG: hypothetical protein ACR2G2_13495 [Pseudonocardia sp.]